MLHEIEFNIELVDIFLHFNMFMCILNEFGRNKFLKLIDEK